MKPHASIEFTEFTSASLRGRHTHGEDGVGHRFGRGHEIGGEPILQSPRCRTRRIAYASAPRLGNPPKIATVRLRRAGCKSIPAAAAGADIRFRAHQYPQMFAIVGNVLADALNNMPDAGRIWLGE